MLQNISGKLLLNADNVFLIDMSINSSRVHSAQNICGWHPPRLPPGPILLKIPRLVRRFIVVDTVDMLFLLPSSSSFLWIFLHDILSG